MGKQRKGEAARRQRKERSYPRLDRADRKAIESGLDHGRSCRQIASSLGRSPSTIHDEVMRHRYITAPRERAGEHAPTEGLADACPRLGAWPRCCNGCRHQRAYGCSRKPHVFYDARLAQKEADRTLSEAREGVDETEESFARKARAIRDGLARGLSPEQIAHSSPELELSKSTIYDWIDRGYAGMANMDLRRKVSYAPRHHAQGRASHATGHSAGRSYGSFCALSGDMRAGAWEMDTVEGRKGRDSRCLLTLFHRPTRLQLAIPLAEKTSQAVLAGLGLVGRAAGGQGAMGRMFRLVLTDNGCEFSDEDALAAAFGEGEGETRLYYCDTMSAWEKGGCERNHSELRKILPKGQGIIFDRLDAHDCALLMSEANSEPRGCLAWSTPIRAFRSAFGKDAEALLDALGIREIPAGELDLTPHCLERLHEKEGRPPLR